MTETNKHTVARLVIEGFVEIKSSQDLPTPSDLPEWCMFPAIDRETLTVVGTIVHHALSNSRWIHLGELDDFQRQALVRCGIEDVSIEFEDNRFFKMVLESCCGRPN